VIAPLDTAWNTEAKQRVYLGIAFGSQPTSCVGTRRACLSRRRLPCMRAVPPQQVPQPYAGVPRGRAHELV